VDGKERLIRSEHFGGNVMATTTMTAHIDTLNSLLRGEIAATETYQQALDKVSDEPEAVHLRRIHGEHRDAANTLRQHIHQFGGQPDQGSGAWGTFAKAVAGTAKIFGDTAALKALKEGEEHGLKEYEEALEEGDLPMECQTLIRTQLLPQTRDHIAILNRSMETIGQR
jgi:uncharacterized protein (TIGR02284 family)